MGSFSWMCACGCGREITPRYTEVNEPCNKCGEQVLDGQKIVVYFPDGATYEGYYADYGGFDIERGIEGEEGLEDIYNWLARANHKNYKHKRNPEIPIREDKEFWAWTREATDEVREEGISIQFPELVHKETGKRTPSREEGLEQGLLIKDENTPYHRWCDDFIPEVFHEGEFFGIKIVWKHCVTKSQSYDNLEISDSAPNQGFGNASKCNECWSITCDDCAGWCCDD